MSLRANQSCVCVGEKAGQTNRDPIVVNVRRVVEETESSLGEVESACVRRIQVFNAQL